MVASRRSRSQGSGRRTHRRDASGRPAPAEVRREAGAARAAQAGPVFAGGRSRARDRRPRSGAHSVRMADQVRRSRRRREGHEGARRRGAVAQSVKREKAMKSSFPKLPGLALAATRRFHSGSRVRPRARGCCRRRPIVAQLRRLGHVRCRERRRSVLGQPGRVAARPARDHDAGWRSRSSRRMPRRADSRSHLRSRAAQDGHVSRRARGRHRDGALGRRRQAEALARHARRDGDGHSRERGRSSRSSRCSGASKLTSPSARRPT